jgi:hypothetical protein
MKGRLENKTHLGSGMGKDYRIRDWVLTSDNKINLQQREQRAGQRDDKNMLAENKGRVGQLKEILPSPGQQGEYGHFPLCWDRKHKMFSLQDAPCQGRQDSLESWGDRDI